MGEFIIDLVSNASSNIYPNNKLSAFTNELSIPIEFRGEYEAAVIEMFYPALLLKKAKKTTHFSLILDDNRATTHKTKFEYLESDSVYDIISKLNTSIATSLVDLQKKMTNERSDYKLFANELMTLEERHFSAPRLLIVDEPFANGKKIAIYPGIYEKKDSTGKTDIKHILLSLLDESFVKLLGFDLKKYEQAILSKNHIDHLIVADDYHDSMFTNNLLFVYCDIIDVHHVGDSMANSLRTVPIIRENSQRMIGHTFLKPIYFPVRMNRITSISILLQDEIGSPINFEYGTVYLTLSLRPARKFLSI